jgi:hypothetical protein
LAFLLLFLFFVDFFFLMLVHMFLYNFFLFIWFQLLAVELVHWSLINVWWNLKRWTNEFTSLQNFPSFWLSFRPEFYQCFFLLSFEHLFYRAAIGIVRVSSSKIFSSLCKLAKFQISGITHYNKTTKFHYKIIYQKNSFIQL